MNNNSGIDTAGGQPTVLITGANRGIGLEFARQYSAMGWIVIAAVRQPDKADALQALSGEHPNLRIEQLDVTDQTMIDDLAARLSDLPVDVLLCNAGISGAPSADQSFGKLDYDLFDPYLRTNALGPLKMAEAFLQNIESSRLKTIAVLSSKAGSFAELEGAAPDTYFYRASKAALNMFMVQVAANVSDRGIKVVLLSPGMVDTSGGVLTEMNEKYKLGLTIIPAEQSVEGMIARIDATSMADSGKIVSYAGEQVGY